MDRLQPWADDLTRKSARKRRQAALRLEELARQGEDLSPIVERLLRAVEDSDPLARRWARLALRAGARAGLDLTGGLPHLCVRAEDSPDIADCLLEYARQNPLAAQRVLQQLGQIRATSLLQDLQLLARHPVPRQHWRWDEAAQRMVQMVQEGAIITASGKRIKTAIGSICVHGDSAHAVESARRVRAGLEAAGVKVSAFAPG